MARLPIFGLLFLLSFLLVIPAKGQSHFFLPFGEQRDEVLSYLESRDYAASVVQDDELNVIRMLTKDRRQVEYAFHGSQLYAITVLNNYRSPHQAAMAQQHVLEYLKASGAPKVNRSGKEPFVCYTALTDTRVLKVFVRQHTNSRSIILTSISREHGPSMSEEDIFYEQRFLEMDNSFVLQSEGNRRQRRR